MSGDLEAVTDAIAREVGAFMPSGRASLDRFMAGLEEIPRAMQAALIQAAETLRDARATRMPIAAVVLDIVEEHTAAYSGIAESAGEVRGAHVSEHASWLET